MTLERRKKDTNLARRLNKQIHVWVEYFTKKIKIHVDRRNTKKQKLK